MQIRSQQLAQALDNAAIEPEAMATSVEHLRDNALAWQRRIELVRGAHESFVVTSYYVDADPYGEAFMRELINAAKRGVDVSITLDFVASKGALTQKPWAERKQLYALFDALKAAGGSIRYFGELNEQITKQAGAGIHFKSMVADGERAIVGGRNLGESYFNDWTDYDLRLEGPIVSTIARAQLALMEHANTGYDDSHQAETHFAEQRARIRDVTDNAAAHMDKSQGRPLHLLLSDPVHSNAANPITKFFVEAARVAQTEIIASSNYVNPSRELRESLMSAARRGAHVMLLTTGKDVGLSNTPYWLSVAHYEEMLKAGVEIYESPTFEHGKMYVIDGEVAGLGSFNLGKPADASLIEGLVMSESPEDITQVRQTLLQSMAKSKRVTSVEVKGALPRLLGWFGRHWDK